jgi:hypothetical protein
MAGGGIVDIEEIQDQVELTLMRAGECDFLAWITYSSSYRYIEAWELM